MARRHPTRYPEQRSVFVDKFHTLVGCGSFFGKAKNSCSCLYTPLCAVSLHTSMELQQYGPFEEGRLDLPFFIGFQIEIGDISAEWRMDRLLAEREDPMKQHSLKFSQWSGLCCFLALH
ncbi:hypothetical protein CEXT_303221 [Caerostris extrusa]|uniref:Uncharacterized protein n=1 Tax=Caerostris extrusa TaxID=172846 RepID=A0AAV4XN57_CAEEX|nr:hypothetical protein CEXT_303221 [Caerostris extrusa]